MHVLTVQVWMGQWKQLRMKDDVTVTADDQCQSQPYH